MSIKEKIENTKNKVVTGVKNAAKKTVEFVQKHPTLTLYILLGGMATTCVIVNSKKKDYEPELKTDISSELTHEEKCEKLSQCLDAILEAENERKKFWNENYKENWDMVNEFAHHINLKPGEMFIIEDSQQYINDKNFTNIDFSMPIVSHLVNMVGIYPPED